MKSPAAGERGSVGWWQGWPRGVFWPGPVWHGLSSWFLREVVFFACS